MLLAQESADLAAAQKSVIGEQLRQARLNFDLGAAVSTDVHEAQARFDLVAAQEISARNDLTVRRRSLNAIIKTDPEKLAGLGPGFRLELPQPGHMQRWVDDAIANSPQIVAQRRALDIAMEEIDRNRYAHYPTLDAVASYGRNSSGSGILGGVGYDTTQGVVGVQIAIPIYQGGTMNSKTREAAANAEKARQELEATSRQVALAVEQAFTGVTSGVSQIEALRAALASTESQVHATRIGFTEGARSSIDLLNAQQQLFQARREVAQAQYGYLMNRLRLSAAAGSMDEGDLHKVSTMLAPRGEANAVPSRPAAKPPDLPASRRVAAPAVEALSGLRLSTELASPPAESRERP